jgi:hypothetical protein
VVPVKLKSGACPRVQCAGPDQPCPLVSAKTFPDEIVLLQKLQVKDLVATRREPGMQSPSLGRPVAGC